MKGELHLIFNFIDWRIKFVLYMKSKPNNNLINSLLCWLHNWFYNSLNFETLKKNNTHLPHTPLNFGSWYLCKTLPRVLIDDERLIAHLVITHKSLIEENTTEILFSNFYWVPSLLSLCEKIKSK